MIGRRPSLPTLLALLSLLGRCDDGRKPPGSPCTSPFDCVGGLCLTLPDRTQVCTARCASASGCPSGQLCGRFDYRGRDDAGVLMGEDSDIVHACRAPLDRRCADGCAPGEACLRGLCAPRCATDLECAGRACVAVDCATRVCQAPCDALGDCGSGDLCDLAFSDADGHGRCIPLDPVADAGADVTDCE